MKTIVKHFLAILVLCSLMTPAQPLHENTAKGLALAGGVLAGTGTGLGVHYVFLKNSSMGALGKSLIIGLSAASVGGLTWWLLDSYLYTLTPRGKMQAATRIINWIEMDSLIAREFATHEDFFNHTNARFGTSWPLVLARDHLMLISTNLSQAYALSQAASQEAAESPEYADLTTNCRALEAKVPGIAKNIEQRINFIGKNAEYQFQVQLHEKYLEEERNRAHERQLQAEKLSHTSWEKSKDRWHETSEKDKDRVLKEILTYNPNRPVIINI